MYNYYFLESTLNIAILNSRLSSTKARQADTKKYQFKEI